MRLDAFWSSHEWRAYERWHDGPPGTRAAVLANAPWTTRVVDLSLSEPELWRDVRRSYHSIINRLKKDVSFAIGEPSDGDAFLDICRPIHLHVSGRETRDITTWILQATWLDARPARGRCFVAWREGRPVGFAYILTSGAWAYYGYAAAYERNVQHALQWYAMRALKASGVRWYETGWQGAATDEKGRNIEMFRRGWGGVDMRCSQELGCE